MKRSPFVLAFAALAACRNPTPAMDAAVADVPPTDVPPADAPPADAPPADAPADDVPLVPCGASSAPGLAACVREADLVRDIATVTTPREPGSAGHDAVRDLCAERFAALGYAVERHEYGTGTNVLGVKPGLGAAAGRVLVSAHYDHIAGCPGADDNGSGVAGVLEAARVLAQGRYDRTLVVACWDEEEAGLVGSTAYAQRARAAGESIAVAYVFEMIGFRSREPGSQRLPPGLSLIFPRQAARIRDNGNRGDFIALIADEGSGAPTGALERAAAAAGLPSVSLTLTAEQTRSPLYGDLQRSDHAPFWAASYPAIQITDTAEFRNPHYHCASGQDSVETLDPDFMTRVVRAAVASAAETLVLRP